MSTPPTQFSATMPVDALSADLARIAAERRGTHARTRHFALFGRIFALEFLDMAVAEHITRPLAHLAVEGGQQIDAKITCWIGENSGDFPQVRVGPEGFGLRCEAPGLSDDTRLTSYAPMGRILSQFDFRTMQGYHCIGDFKSMWRHEHAIPLRTLFSWVALSFGIQLFHVGGVGSKDGCILLSGRGGSGKSNTVATAINTDLGILGDDFCAIEERGGTMIAHALYSTSSVRRGDYVRNPALADLPVLFDPEQPNAKLVHDLAQGAHMLAQAPVRAMAMVRQGGEAFGLKRIPAGAIARDLALDTQTMLPYAQGEVMSMAGALLRSVPAYVLELGPDPSAIAPGLERLVARAQAGALP
ncbi:MAG: hypothetical protein AAF647_03395 [Pseudomonadota bacterium]